MPNPVSETHCISPVLNQHPMSYDVHSWHPVFFMLPLQIVHPLSPCEVFSICFLKLPPSLPPHLRTLTPFFFVVQRSYTQTRVLGFCEKELLTSSSFAVRSRSVATFRIRQPDTILPSFLWSTVRKLWLPHPTLCFTPPVALFSCEYRISPRRNFYLFA